MGMSLGYLDAHDPPYPMDMVSARQRVKAACEAAGLYFLNAVNDENVRGMIDEGVMFCATGRSGESAAVLGPRPHRAHDAGVAPVASILPWTQTLPYFKLRGEQQARCGTRLIPGE